MAPCSSACVWLAQGAPQVIVNKGQATFRVMKVPKLPDQVRLGGGVVMHAMQLGKWLSCMGGPSGPHAATIPPACCTTGPC